MVFTQFSIWSRHLIACGEKIYQQLQRLTTIWNNLQQLIRDAFVVGFEVNFMDDVGQTLLNWASAFGTQEMVSLVQFHISFLPMVFSFVGLFHYILGYVHLVRYLI